MWKSPCIRTIESVKRAHCDEHPGACTIPWMPSSASTTNQASITGPNILPIEASAFPLHNEKPDQDDEGERHPAGASDGASTFRPSSALSTEMAGVMAPSP